MKNKIRFKKYIGINFIICLIFISLFLNLNIYEYNTYTKNMNNKIDLIISKVQSKYPDIKELEIMNIINNDEKSKNSILEKYGIDLDKDSVIEENKEKFNEFLFINTFGIIISFVIIIFIFFLYDRGKDKQIGEITKYIEEINKKNYSLKIDEISEDELSILKNEIYKVTVMLKENADNSQKDKVQLKKSLEDISHQIKTPLTSILVILDNLIDDPDMDEKIRQDFIRDIKREVANINSLVQALLKLSKLDSNTIKFIRDTRFLKDIIDEAVKNVSVTCDLKNISIDVESKQEVKLKCDFMWEVEALTNIIKNCVEHSKNDSKIIIKCEENSVYASVSIRDFGEGIAKEDLPHIFERFYKSRNVKKDSIGIGLALAKTIIESDNGSIDVVSDEKGTKFLIKYFKF